VVAGEYRLRDPHKSRLSPKTMDRIIGNLAGKREEVYVFLMSYAKANSYVVQPAQPFY
jgi:hypothetical protein